MEQYLTQCGFAVEERGVCPSELVEGTILLVRTQNSLYVLEIGAEPRWVTVSGGKYFRRPCQRKFLGSIEGDMTHPDFIARGMRMEFSDGLSGDPVKTSPVVNLRVVPPTPWYYEGDSR